MLQLLILQLNGRDDSVADHGPPRGFMNARASRLFILSLSFPRVSLYVLPCLPLYATPWVVLGFPVGYSHVPCAFAVGPSPDAFFRPLHHAFNVSPVPSHISCVFTVSPPCLFPSDTVRCVYCANREIHLGASCVYRAFRCGAFCLPLPCEF